MNLGNMLKGFFIYKEPKEYDRFELLEDEPEDKGQMKNEGTIQDTPAISNAPNTQNTQDIQDTRTTKQKSKLRTKLSGWLQGDSNKDTKQKENDPNNKDIVAKKIQANLEKIKLEFNSPTNQDVVIREFKVLQQCNAFIVYIDGMADNKTINDFILRQLMEYRSHEINSKNNIADYVENNLLAANQITKESDYKQIIKQVLNGLTALFMDGCEQCILIESRGFEKRTISPPLNETVIRGPQEAFIESLRTNITLVRKIIRRQDLVTEMIPVGRSNNMTCAILYIKDITNPRIIEEVKRRINSLDIDYIANDGILDQLIEDHPFALFPQILSTERPDRTASFLMDGKVAIICDGAPYASVVPITFFHMLHTSEDYNLRWQYDTFLRIIRLIAAFLSVFLPGLYIALTLYHPEMIPAELMTSLLKARELLPFPAIIELLSMEISWEIIREASVRVPGVIGQTLGIVGGVILGQAAVAAGLVSPILIIIVAITGLASYTIPNYSLGFGTRILRFAFTLLGAVAGFYGIAAGVFIFGGLACSMKSFGVPYFSPVAPKTKANRDLVIRAPSWMQDERPDFLNTQDRTRAGKVVRGWTKGGGKGDGQQ